MGWRVEWDVLWKVCCSSGVQGGGVLGVQGLRRGGCDNGEGGGKGRRLQDIL